MHYSCVQGVFQGSWSMTLLLYSCTMSADLSPMSVFVVLSPVADGEHVNSTAYYHGNVEFESRAFMHTRVFLVVKRTNWNRLERCVPNHSKAISKANYSGWLVIISEVHICWYGQMDWDYDSFCFRSVIWIPIELCCKLTPLLLLFFSIPHGCSYIPSYKYTNLALLQILLSLESLHKGEFGLASLIWFIHRYSRKSFSILSRPGLLHAITNQPAESDHIVLGYRSSILAGQLIFVLHGSCALVAIKGGRKRVSYAVSLHHINHNHCISGTLDSAISPSPALAHCEDR